MSDKYIIKNCPAILHMTKLCDSENMEKPSDYCINCTDCVMKQIVELAKGYKEELIDRETKKTVAIRYFPLTKDILELLDIEECE